MFKYFIIEFALDLRLFLEILTNLGLPIEPDVGKSSDKSLCIRGEILYLVL